MIYTSCAIVLLSKMNNAIILVFLHTVMHLMLVSLKWFMEQNVADMVS